MEKKEANKKAMATRRAQLNEAARRFGFENWSEAETAVKNGEAEIASPPGCPEITITFNDGTDHACVDDFSDLISEVETRLGVTIVQVVRYG